jgi:translation elongation factor EF-Tu-like GTPase
VATFSPDLQASITLVPTEEGGRSTPIYARCKYRPQVYYDDAYWDAALELSDVEEIHPGQSGQVFLSFLRPEQHFGRLVVGSEFLLREGIKVVARCVVTSLLNLETSALMARERAS